MGYSPLGRKESDTTEHLSMHAYTEKDWGVGIKETA